MASQISDAATQYGDDRYFYILHRPSDSYRPRPEKVREIVKSGGVSVLSRYDERRVKYTRDASDNGVSAGVSSVLSAMLSVDRLSVSNYAAFASEVNWFYLNSSNHGMRRNILEMASDEELIFRVPEKWLLLNALSCVEHPAASTQYKQRAGIMVPWGFLTDLTVPLEYRLTSPTPLPKEQRRQIDSTEVGNLIYHEHVKFNRLYRDENNYASPPPLALGIMHPHINPF